MAHTFAIKPIPLGAMVLPVCLFLCGFMAGIYFRPIVWEYAAFAGLAFRDFVMVFTVVCVYYVLAPRYMLF